MLSVASVPQSYPGRRLRIAPVKTLALTDAAIVAGAEKLYADVREIFSGAPQFSLKLEVRGADARVRRAERRNARSGSSDTRGDGVMRGGLDCFDAELVAR